MPAQLLCCRKRKWPPFLRDDPVLSWFLTMMALLSRVSSDSSSGKSRKLSSRLSSLQSRASVKRIKLFIVLLLSPSSDSYRPGCLAIKRAKVSLYYEQKGHSLIHATGKKKKRNLEYSICLLYIKRNLGFISKYSWSDYIFWSIHLPSGPRGTQWFMKFLALFVLTRDREGLFLTIWRAAEKIYKKRLFVVGKLKVR